MSDYAQVCARLDEQERLIRQLFEQQRQDLLAQLAARLPLDRKPPELSGTKLRSSCSSSTAWEHPRFSGITPRSSTAWGQAAAPPAAKQQVMTFDAGLADLSEDSDASDAASESGCFLHPPPRPKNEFALLERHDDQKAIVPRNKIQQWLLPITQNSLFQVSVGIVVVLNVIFMGVDIESRFRDKTQPGLGHRAWVERLEAGFLFFFTTEILLRLLAEQCAFFHGPNSKWNFFESFIVVMSLLEACFSMNNGSSSLRVLRVLRVVRAVRIVRVFRFFHQLRLMLISLVSCFLSMMWALLLLLLMIYFFALYLEEIALAHLDHYPFDAPDAVTQQIADNWHGMVPAVFSLIYSISGGSDWSDLAAPFMKVNIFHGCMYTLFILFTTLGIFNILVGIFVQQAERIAEWDKGIVIQEELMKMDSIQEDLEGVFHAIDRDCGGSISFDELAKALDDKEVQAYLSHLEIDTTRVDILFDLIDADGDGAISKDEFVSGFLRLKGSAKPSELVSLMRVGNSIMTKVVSLEERIMNSLAQQPRVKV